MPIKDDNEQGGTKLNKFGTKISGNKNMKKLKCLKSFFCL